MEQNPAIDTFIDLLKQGKSVIHVAEGYSMFPTLRPGDKVLVRPLAEGELPEVGSVVVIYNGATVRWCDGAMGPGLRERGARRGERGVESGEHREKGLRAQGAGHREEETASRKPEAGYPEFLPGLVLHRLVDIKKDDKGKTIFITQGDSMTHHDLPWQLDNIIGIAVSFNRNGRSGKLRKRRPVEIFYLRNKILLSAWLFFSNPKED